MKVFSSFFLSCLMVFSFAQKYAVHFTNAEEKLSFIQRCMTSKHDYTILREENTAIIDHVDINELKDFGFVSEVRVLDYQLVFNTQTLLLKMAPNFKGTIADQKGVYKVRPHAFIPQLYYVDCLVSSESELSPIIEHLEKLEGFMGLECKQVFTLQASSNDPLFNRQWSIENTGSAVQFNGTIDADMDVDSAWTITEGESSIKIAILDSGVDTLHQDLSANTIAGFDGFATDSTDTRGYPTPNFDSDAHGTACAGIAAARANNSLGIAGIAPNCKIIPIRIFYYQDYGGSIGIQATTNTDALLSGSAYAWRVANADIMSTSAGLSSLFIGVLDINVQLVSDEINEAFISGRSGYGVPMFFSAGNDDFNDVLWPGDLENTIAVGASTMCDERKNPTDCSPESWGSSYGLSLDVVAPGVRITTTDITGLKGYSSNSYTFTFNGTSAACPNAAGVGALILSFSPGLHARDVKAILNITAERVGGYAYDSIGLYGTWNEEMGHGRVNAFEAVKLSETFASSVGINEMKERQSLSFYPNPSDGIIYLDNQAKDLRSISICNLLGMRVKSFDLTTGINKLNCDLPAGIYFIQGNAGQYFGKLQLK